MGVAWTEEQKKVISLRGRNILVSAAAGSGKTAVLVQRILSKVMDKENPVDIDRLLIMTFTRAAAGEMRERISRALEQAVYEDPDNEHLQRQMNLVHTAQITTIDGFCAYIIRNYFHMIGLDPGYRTADEGEIKLLKEDVMKELIEDAYGSGEKKFHEFVECYAAGKTDEGLKDYILKVYEAAMSHPDPEKWLDECLKAYRTETVEELRGAEWMKLLWESAGEELSEAQDLLTEAKCICLEDGGPYLYEEALDSDLLFLARLQELSKARDFDGMASLLVKPAFARLSGKKAEHVDESKKEEVKALREEAKTMIKELGSRYFPESEEDILAVLKLCRNPMESLVELTLEFTRRFGEKKREKNLLDFTDMEHFALKILMADPDEKTGKGVAAAELSEKYEEVLVDEYQDSNLVQELLTVLVSGWVKGRKNIFMVGDVKQSIYRFRLARPELFMEKYRSYSLEDSGEQRIDLHKNFRSRPQVLESVNFIFRQIMGEDLGGISYDDAAALYPGAAFPEGEDPEFVKTEVLLIEKDGEELAEEAGGGNARELEALAVAQKISSMVGRERILDKETGAYRPVEYGDIVILLRTASGWAETFSQVLASKGIPSYTVSRTGYFSAPEVVTILNFLRISDNPRQDIPLTGVLRSPIAGCTAQELALLRSECPRGMLFDSVRSFTEDGQLVLFPEENEKERLREKLRSFLKLLEEVRDLAQFTPIHELILYVMKSTGYGDYARALPDGSQRSANLHMLVEKAMEYEKTSYRGLFNFVRYIENLQKYEVDFGEVNLRGAGTSSVQIMTIHKSKGLEFPVVIAAGMGKQFNFQDINSRLLLHSELGFGADAILPERRLIVTSLYKQIIRRELLRESLGEELRVLYVAFTRAKEKLILTGTIGNLEKQLPLLARYRDRKEALLPVGTRMKGKNYWSYVLPALARHRCMDGLYEEYGLQPGKTNPLYGSPAEFFVHKVTAQELIGEEVLLQADSQIQEEILTGWDCGRVYDAEIRTALEERFGFVYPFSYLSEIPAKVSVSELKKRSYAGEFEKEEAAFWEEDVVPLIPAFVAEKEEAFSGAARGTAYHRVMECLDYSRVSKETDVEAQIKRLVELQKMTEQEAACVCVADIWQFVNSSLGKRMESAALDGNLYREQPFVISVPAASIDERWQGKETVLVQGIIDAYFIEEEDIVLVDYKTDRVTEGQRLVELYHTQLEDYAGALKRMLGKRVKEAYIYSFTLQEEIRVPVSGGE